MSIDITGYGFSSGGLMHFTPSETYDLCCKGAILVDVRENYINGFKMFGVENVIYLPYSALETRYSGLAHDSLLICADSAGLMSKESVLYLQKKGFKSVYNMAGGMVEWERDGLPITIDLKEKLSGSCMCQLKPRDRKFKNY